MRSRTLILKIAVVASATAAMLGAGIVSPATGRRAPGCWAPSSRRGDHVTGRRSVSTIRQSHRRTSLPGTQAR